MNNNAIEDKIINYFGKTIRQHGPCAKGVDWNSQESQYIRFDQLSKIGLDKSKFTLNDFGCGYGAFLDYIIEKKIPCTEYNGYDISTDMIEAARDYWKEKPVYTTTSFFNSDKLSCADYSIASGVFNIRCTEYDSTWWEYIKEALCKINENSIKGFSFNMLTTYSDKEYMKDYLYYANPSQVFDFCKTSFSRNVALLHDYNVYEFTILVKK